MVCGLRCAHVGEFGCHAEDDEVPTVLVVDDDPQIRDVLSVTLPLHWPGTSVVTARDGDEALRAFREQEPDAILLDVVLPDRSGLEVLRQIRQVSDTPVILLTGQGDEIDQVRGFQIGADDFVVKPFSLLVLTARIHSILRRTNPSSGAEGAPDIEIGPIMISLSRQEAAVHGRPIQLTPVEFTLLQHLAQNAGQVLTYTTLLTRIWGPDSYRTADHLRVCISRLRSKIEQAGGPRCIENERGLGYRFARLPPSR